MQADGVQEIEGQAEKKKMEMFQEYYTGKREDLILTLDQTQNRTRVPNRNDTHSC